MISAWIKEAPETEPLSFCPDCYNGYKYARWIVDDGGQKIALRALISDSNQLPIPGVTASFWINGDSEPNTSKPAQLVKKTASKGRFFVKNLPGGTYLVELKKAGYAPQNHTVYINEGEMTVLEASLQEL